MSDFTTVSIGMIMSHTANLENCFERSKQYMEVDGQGAAAVLYSNHNCEHVFGNPDVKIINASIILLGERNKVAELFTLDSSYFSHDVTQQIKDNYSADDKQIKIEYISDDITQFVVTNGIDTMSFEMFVDTGSITF